MKGAFFFFFLFSTLTYSQSFLPYKLGEYSAFDISFRGIKVGSAKLEIKSVVEIDGTSTFYIQGKGRTSPFFDIFFKVRDIYETYLDTINIRPVKFVRDINEGGFTKKQLYFFRHHDSLVSVNDSNYVIYPNTQDMLSALFYARTFKKDVASKKESFFVPIFMDEENYSLEVLFLYNEKIKTSFGVLSCMVFTPKMQEGRVFQDGERMKIWISDDQNRLLVKVETEIWAGIIQAVLVEHKEVKYPLSISK